MENDLRIIEEIFGKVERADSTYEVRKTAKYYRNIVKVFTPNQPYSKKIPYLEEIDPEDELPDVEIWDEKKGSNSTEDNLERSLRKTKTLIQDYILCTPFNLFVTFTFSPEKTDRQNPDLVKSQMANWLRNQRKRNGRFKYLIVPEFHKDKKSLHFHALFYEYPGQLTPTEKFINRRKVFHLKSYTLGFNSAVKIDNPERLSSYVRKYITKDMPQFHNKRRFWASKGLERPHVVDNPDDLEHLGLPIYERTTEYGIIQIFEKKEGDEEVKAS